MEEAEEQVSREALEFEVAQAFLAVTEVKDQEWLVMGANHTHGQMMIDVSNLV